MQDMSEPRSTSPPPTRQVTELNLDARPEGADRLILTVSGELDMHTAPRLREALAEGIAGGRPHLVLECSDLRFVDSTGLGILVVAHKRAVESGGELRIRSPSRILAKLLTITKLDAVFLDE